MAMQFYLPGFCDHGNDRRETMKPSPLPGDYVTKIREQDGLVA